MEWTEEFTEDMRQRYLLQHKVFLALLFSSFLFLLLWFIFILKKIGPLDIFLGMVFICILFVLEEIAAITFLKRNLWVRQLSYFTLIFDVLSSNFIVYIFGGITSLVVVLLLMIIVFYSIFLHPKLAVRYFVLSMPLFITLNILSFEKIIPFAYVFTTDPNYHFLMDFHLREENRIAFLLGIFLMTFICFSMLYLVNSMVYKLKERESELEESNDRIGRLSDKLKVFLPHQFVESLEKDEAESEPAYKRRKLTVFFSDVKGFTAWTDRLEPEDTRELLNQYLSEMSKIAHKWGGTIDKFIGDAIMIFFGDPEFTNDKDHACRCVKMAMEMQEKMKDLRAEWEDLGHEEPLHIRIGVNTGYVTVGTFGSEDRRDYTVLGSSVNLASRLETACTPDEITVSHATYSLIKGEIECESKGTIEAKGFSEPVKIYEIVGSNIESESGNGKK